MWSKKIQVLASIATIAGTAIATVGLWPDQPAVVTVVDESSQPYADVVLICGKAAPVYADSFGRFNCPADWIGERVEVFDTRVRRFVKRIESLGRDTTIMLETRQMKISDQAVKLIRSGMDRKYPGMNRPKQIVALADAIGMSDRTVKWAMQSTRNAQASSKTLTRLP